MHRDEIESAAPIIGHPIFLILVSFPIACFSGALATDIAYTRTADMMWADFSAWLLAVGILLGVVAAFAGAIQLVATRRVLGQRPIWPFAIGSFLVLILAFFDNLVHSRDAWTSIVPTGLALSAVTVAATLVTILLGSAYGHRYSVAARKSERLL
jgi:uncharacterized membrane protein